MDGFESWQSMMLRDMGQRSSRARESAGVMAESADLFDGCEDDE